MQSSLHEEPDKLTLMPDFVTRDITHKGGLRRSNINDLNHALRRMLRNHGDYVRPIELVNQLLDARR